MPQPPQRECWFDPTRPCSSRTRAKNRYTRKDIEEAAGKCDVRPVKRVKMDALCASVKTKAWAHAPAFVPDDNVPVVNTPITPAPGWQDAIQMFKAFFRDDLVGWMTQTSANDGDGKGVPQFRVALTGGYGIKTLLEAKHRMHDRIQTADLDFTLGTQQPERIRQIYNYWLDKVYAFIRSHPRPDLFQVKQRWQQEKHQDVTVNFMTAYKTYAFIFVEYAGADFVDITFTNLVLRDSMFEREYSLQTGLPLKTEEYYLKEMLKMVYMENVAGENEYCYKVRNPVVGEKPNKGAQDITRAKLLCRALKDPRYDKYCKLVASVKPGSLQALDKAARDRMFAPLREIAGVGEPITSCQPKTLAFDEAVDSFKRHFRDQLIGWLQQQPGPGHKAPPLWRAVVTGGHGLKSLLESKYRLPNEVETSDLDITVSTQDPRAALADLQAQIHAWQTHAHPHAHMQVSTRAIKPRNQRIMGTYRTFYVLQISIARHQHIDIAITDMPMPVALFDVDHSLRTGLPLKKARYYLMELLQMVYLDNVPGGSASAYLKRNPVTGFESRKGANDIARAKLMCGLLKGDPMMVRFQPYCGLLEGGAPEHLHRMSQQDRDAHYAKLRELF